MKHPTFCRWVKVGRVLCAIPKLRDDLREGRVTLSELEQLASASAASAKEKQTATPAPNFVTLSIAAPAPAIQYLEDSLQLARGFVGATDGDEDAVNALLAEAATECEDRVDVTVAHRRFHVREDGSRRGGEDQQRPPIQTSKISTLSGQQVSPSLPQLALPMMSETARRNAAFRVHSILVRLLKRRDRLQVRQEDLLYEWMLDRIHERSGFRKFERFAQEILGLPYGTFRERLRHARMRRLENPIALARRDGEITAIQAELLDHLYRTCGVPTSDLPAWIHYATEHTARRLRAALRWAKREIHIDYRRWSLARCAPPDEDQFRTTDHSLETLVRHSGTDTLADALITWETAPRATLRLCLTRETRDELLVQMASMQDELRGGAISRVRRGWHYVECSIARGRPGESTTRRHPPRCAASSTAMATNALPPSAPSARTCRCTMCAIEAKAGEMPTPTASRSAPSIIITESTGAGCESGDSWMPWAAVSFGRWAST